MVLLIVYLITAVLPSFTFAMIDDFDSFTKNVSSTLDLLLNESTYDRRLRPDFGGPPTMVEVNMHIKSMGPINENEQKYMMDVYFRQSWVDRRLRWEVPGLEEFSMSWLFMSKVWKPDTYFVNGKKSHLHRITSPNTFFRLRNDGFITYSMRLTVAATCKMRLRKFPLDIQKCPLVIGSYGYTTEDLVYIWSPKSVTVENGLEMAQYDLINITTKDNKLSNRGKDEYSVVEAQFYLKRTIGFFVLQIYVPCSLIVSCSWISFWITPGDVPGRCSLAVMTVLSITTLGFGGRSQLPQVSHATALDWWVIFCFTFVFAVLIEYAVINFMDKVRIDIKRMLDQRELAMAEAKDAQDRDSERKKIESDTYRVIPTIKIEVTEFRDDVSIGTTYEQELVIVQQAEKGSRTTPPFNISTDTKKKEDKKKSPALLDVEGTMRSQKRWRSVPNVLAPEHLAGMAEKDWLKNVKMPPETLRQRIRRYLMAPIIYWRELRILPTEEDVKSGFDRKKFSRIDILARKAFPACFTLFVSMYTLLYAYYIQDDAFED